MKRTRWLLIVTSIIFVSSFALLLLKIRWEERKLKSYPSTSTKHEVKATETPQLYIEGNQIKRKDTGDTVILKGVTSDAFRHRKGKYADTNELFRRLAVMKESGGNLITFWVTPEGYESREDLAEKIVDFADKDGVYVMWAAWDPYPEDNEERRTVLMLKIANKFRNRNNIIYGLNVEPWQEWSVVVDKGTKLGQEIRAVNPDAVLFLPGGSGGRKIDQGGNDKFPFTNTIFGTEDYLTERLEDLKIGQERDDYREAYAWQDSSYLQLPILVTEMGGVSGSGFGSPQDLGVIQRMLNDLEKRGFSYQMHSLDTYDSWKFNGVETDLSGLGLFDSKGDLTDKGQLYFEFLSNHPGTKIKE